MEKSLTDRIDELNNQKHENNLISLEHRMRDLEQEWEQNKQHAASIAREAEEIKSEMDKLQR